MQNAENLLFLGRAIRSYNADRKICFVCNKRHQHLVIETWKFHEFIINNTELTLSYTATSFRWKKRRKWQNDKRVDHIFQ